MHKRIKIKKTEDWYSSLLEFLQNNCLKSIEFNGHIIKKKNGVLLNKSALSKKQNQTKKTFGFKWNKTQTYQDGINKTLGNWLKERYNKKFYKKVFQKNSIILDAGCGSSLSSTLLFGKNLKNIRYIGADVSNSVEIAKLKFKKKKINSIFFQCDLNNLPFFKNSFDLIFSEGVLHHTDDAFKSLKNISKLLKKNGLIMFYVYKKKGPIREFSDQYIKEQLKKLSPHEAWKKLLPLTKLGEELGKLKKKINITEDIDFLEIPKGEISVQRLFYWHVFKIFYGPDLSFNEMQHINFDWYSPQNASTHTEQEVKQWCKKISLSILDIKVDNAGITIIAKK